MEGVITTEQDFQAVRYIHLQPMQGTMSPGRQNLLQNLATVS